MMNLESEEEMDVDEPDAVDEPDPVDDLDLILGGGEGANVGSDNDGNPNEGDSDNQDAANGMAPGESDGTKKEPKKKRVILNPQPKLNYHTLTGKRGLCAMKEIFADIQLKGKGHELSDLNRVMTKLEYWTHRLFPRYNFDEVLARVEKLGAKRQVEVYMKRMRLGMDDILNPISKEFIDEEPASPPPPEPEPLGDAFDSLLPTEPIVPVTTPKPRVEITEEQRERMERNRQLALEKRLARIEAQKAAEQMQAGEPTAGPSGVRSRAPADDTTPSGNLFESSQVLSNPNTLVVEDLSSSGEKQISDISSGALHGSQPTAGPSGVERRAPTPDAMPYGNLFESSQAPSDAHASDILDSEASSHADVPFDHSDPEFNINEKENAVNNKSGISDVDQYSREVDTSENVETNFAPSP
nr:PREDICTED: TIMELESS-interacting protein [Bemisia tabaci]